MRGLGRRLNSYVPQCQRLRKITKERIIPGVRELH
ncbi:hypothetical protein I3843_08G002400 [Carya illinoinensis]|nr:hypothetical protein I3843_08G002400 [Carya illinoinensis]